jgi:peroxiredoxin family protein
MILDIFKKAEENIIIIDSYADNTLLDIICRLKVSVTIITKENNLLIEQDIKKYNMQYHNLKVIYDNTFHDQYFVIDNKKVYHCGTSINIIGYKTFSITEICDKVVFNSLLNKIKISHNK